MLFVVSNVCAVAHLERTVKLKKCRWRLQYYSKMLLPCTAHEAETTGIEVNGSEGTAVRQFARLT